MKPVAYVAPWITTDLTQGLPHRLVDPGGAVRYVILFPKTWERYGHKRTLPIIGGTMDVQNYRVLTWEEVEISTEKRE